MAETLSVAQARIQLYPTIDRMESEPDLVIEIRSRSGANAVLISAARYEELTAALSA